MGGGQNKQKLKYDNIRNRELAIKGFEKMINSHFSHSNNNKNINEQSDSADIIYKSQLNEQLESSESILFAYKVFLSMINKANSNLLCNNIYSSLLANQIVEYDQDNMNETTKRFKQDYQTNVNILTKELLEYNKDKQEQNHNFLLQLSKTFTPSSILLKNEESSLVKIGGPKKKELINNNKGICGTNTPKKNGIEKEQIGATIKPNKPKSTIYYPTTDIDKLIDDKNKESFSTAREELDEPKKCYEMHKEISITSPKAKVNNLYKTLMFKTKKPNKTIKIQKEEILKTKSLKSPKNLTSISNKQYKKNSSTLFKIDIKDLIKQSNQSTNNTIDYEDYNINEKQSTLNMTFVECIDKFLGIDKNYLNKKKQLNLVPKKIKKPNFNKYSYFNNKSIIQNQSTLTPYKRPLIVKKKKTKNNVESLLHSSNNHINNKITEESISNTINYGNYTSTLSKQNKSNELSNIKENNQNEENKNNFFNSPNYIVEDILKDPSIQIYYNNSNLFEQTKHIPTVKEDGVENKNKDEISHVQKDENEINLTDSEEYLSAVSSYPSVDLKREQLDNQMSNIS